MEKKTDQTTDVARSLGIGGSSGRGRGIRRWLVVLLLMAAVAAAVLMLKMSHSADDFKYTTQEVRSGDLLVTVTATGNLEPTNKVDVGSELSGIIRSVEADFNDRVKVNQVLARLDTSRLEAQVLQSRASLESAKARVLQAQATVREAGSNLARLRKVRELSGNRTPSQYEIDAAEAAQERALADEASAHANVSQAKAALEVNETDLSKAVIHSPINGIVLTRSVEPGQTVAASLQAPVLFTLAEDLARMELHVDVDEADVAQVREGQEAAFTVDAYPDRVFKAMITQVRFGSETRDGVVTYKAVLKVDNADLSLRPGMTATADITVKKVKNALLVPNAALRFTPPEGKKSAANAGLFRILLPRPPRGEAHKGSKQGINSREQNVWTMRDGALVTVPVSTGVTDGTMTEVSGGRVRPGMALVIDAAGAGR
jgi:HlyD family secretion protein